MRALQTSGKHPTVPSGAMATGQSGFSLIELMVALIAGLIVLGATLTFTVSTMRSHSDNILATRVSQELRTVMSLTTRELRRAGYNEDAIGRVGTGVASGSPLDQMFINADGSCVLFGYDAAGGTPGVLDAGEAKGIRRIVTGGFGRVQYHPGGAVRPGCDSDAGWLDLSDPASINITRLVFTPAPAGAGGVRIRQIAIELAGSPRFLPDFLREMESTVRVRSDCIRSNLTTCANAPGV